MPTTLPPDWWRRRRILGPVIALLVLGGAVGLSWRRAEASRVVVYNETSDTLAALTLTACGQTQTFYAVGARESVRCQLAPTGGESDITLATNGVSFWRGEYLEPRGGYRVVLRLQDDGAVLATVTISPWRRGF